MTRAPSRAAIHAAEMQFLASGHDTRVRLRRLQAAFRSALARPSTLALVGGAAGIAGFCLVRRPRLRSAASTAGVTVAATATLAGLLRAYALRYGMHYLPVILRQLWAERSKPAHPSARRSPSVS